MSALQSLRFGDWWHCAAAGLGPGWGGQQLLSSALLVRHRSKLVFASKSVSRGVVDSSALFWKQDELIYIRGGVWADGQHQLDDVGLKLGRVRACIAHILKLEFDGVGRARCNQLVSWRIQALVKPFWPDEALA